jgi:hypothetical protein
MTFDLPTRPRAIVTEPPMRAPTGAGGWRWTWRAQQTFPPVAEAIRLMLQTGLPQMMGTRLPRKWLASRENGRDRANRACYYARL